MIDRIGYAGVLSNIGTREIHDSLIIHNYILKDSAFFDSSKDFRFFFGSKVNYLGIATSLEVEYCIFRSPTMFVVADKVTVRIGRKGSLTCSRKTKENSCITIFTYVGRAVHRHSVSEYRKLKVHSREDSFFDLSSISSTSDKRNLTSKVQNSKIPLACTIYFRVGQEAGSVDH